MTQASDLWDAELDADRFQPDPEVDELLVGGVDLHTHPGPSPFPRRMSIWDAAVDAASAGFYAIVAKSHHQSMQTDVLALKSRGLDDIPTKVFAGIALNNTVGGINPYGVELALRMGGKVVWFPTLSSQAHIHHHEHGGAFPMAGIQLRDHEPLSVLDENGKLNEKTLDVIDIIAQEDAILNCGHLPAAEIDVLVPGAFARGVTRVVISHPDFIIGADPQILASWCRQGAYVEHCMAMVVRPAPGEKVLDRIGPYYDLTGPSQTILSSDLGQAGNPLPITAYRRMVRGLLDLGVAPADIQVMVGGNARQLLG